MYTGAYLSEDWNSGIWKEGMYPGLSGYQKSLGEAMFRIADLDYIMARLQHANIYLPGIEVF